jgi:four helix bundle protein
MPTYSSFKELDCWKKCQLAKRWIYEFLKQIPKNEFDVHDNMKRAARSTTRNIAEGFGRFHYKENIQFCRISRGSLHELLDDLDDCVLAAFVSAEQTHEGEELIKDAILSVNGYINYLQRRLENK